MKIQRFNESYNYEYEDYSRPKNMSKEIFEYLENFAGSCDYNIIEWVSSVSNNTKLKQYSNLTKSKKSALYFSESKNLQKIKELIEIQNHIDELDKEYKNIIKNKDRIHVEASNELIYLFQEELLNSDFDKFFELFIEDLYNEYINGYIDDEEIYYDIHPNIMKEYGKKIIENINILIQSKKYNL